jgi:hypothetical protein
LTVLLAKPAVVLVTARVDAEVTDGALPQLGALGTAVAATDVELLVIRQERLEWLIRNRPQLTREILKRLADMLAKSERVSRYPWSTAGAVGCDRLWAVREQEMSSGPTAGLKGKP